MNVSAEPQELKAGTIIGIYKPIDKNQIEETSVWAQSVLPGACQEHNFKCPANARALLKLARPVCETDEQNKKLASLLTAYQDVFS